MTDHRAPALRRAALVLLAAYLLVLAAAVLLPPPWAQVPRGTGPEWELTLRAPDLLGGWEGQRNVLMTVPFGVLLPLVVRWRYEVLVAACVALTLVVETTQLAVSATVGWAWRAFDVNDLLLNTLGGLLGLALTGAVLLVTRRAAFPPPRRLVPGLTATAVVGWAVVATVAARGDAPPVDACDVPPAAAVTALPGGASAYAGPDGSVCLTAGGGTSSVPADTGTGPAVMYERDGGVWEIGTALPGDVVPPQADGTPVALHPVAGTSVLVWAALR